MKISDYERTSSLGGGDLFLVDKPELGTKTIEAREMLAKLYSTLSAQEGADLIPNVYDDKNSDKHDRVMVKNETTTKMINLNKLIDAIVRYGLFSFQKNMIMSENRAPYTTFSDEQKQSIRDGTFSGLSLGDTWYIGGYFYRIVGFNSFTGIGNGINQKLSAGTPHDGMVPNHVVVLCRQLARSKWEDDASKNHVLYKDCSLRKKLQPGGAIYNMVAGAFGEDWICRHRCAFPSVRDENGNSITHVADNNCYLELPTVQMFGHIFFDTKHEFSQEQLCFPMPLLAMVNYYHSWWFTAEVWTRTKRNNTGIYAQNTYNGLSLGDEHNYNAYACPYFLLGKFNET